MPTLKFTGFQGIIPKVSPRLLPDAAAQIANNVKISSGELHSYNAAVREHVSTKTKPDLAIYRAVYGALSSWMTWPFDVDAVRAPFDVSVEPTFCWTGDVEPKFGTYSNVADGGGSDYPHTFYSLGLPVPQTAPGVGHAGGTGTAVSRYYAYTFVGLVGTRVEETGPSPVSTITAGKVDGTWSISGMDAAPANSGTGTGAFTSVTTFTTTAAAKHWLRAGETVVLGGTDCTILAVPSSSTFTVAGDHSAATTWARKTPWNTTGLTKRLYRSSGSAAALQLVAEGITATTYSDTLLDAAIPGDDLISDGWEPPPVGLRGLCVHPSGALVGFTGNLLCFSVPYQPHAWRAADQKGCDFDIVAIGLAGSDVVVATSANPYVAIGLEPESITLQKSGDVYPCLSKRSLCSNGDAVLFASKAGMIQVTGGRASVATTPWFTSDEWAEFSPASMFSAFASERLFVGYVDPSGVRRMLAFNLDVGQLTMMDVVSYELYRDDTSGTLYIATDTDVSEFDAASGAPLVIEYQTKEVVLSTPTNFGACRIQFESGITQAQLDAITAAQGVTRAANAALITAKNLVGGFGARSFNADAIDGSSAEALPAVPAYSSLTFVLYSAGVPVFSRVVSTTEAFRLPSGFKTDRISIKVSGQTNIAYIVIGETMKSLAAA